MNPFPLQALQTEITAHCAIHGRGMMNSLNPLDHPWNFDSATVAKHRVRAVIKADRESIRDMRWVEVTKGGWFELWHPGRSFPRYEYFKPRYRLEARL